jgi:hypothetical protein
MGGGDAFKAGSRGMGGRILSGAGLSSIAVRPALAAVPTIKVDRTAMPGAHGPPAGMLDWSEADGIVGPNPDNRRGGGNFRLIRPRHRHRRAQRRSWGRGVLHLPSRTSSLGREHRRHAPRLRAPPRSRRSEGLLQDWLRKARVLSL